MNTCPLAPGGSFPGPQPLQHPGADQGPRMLDHPEVAAGQTPREGGQSVKPGWPSSHCTLIPLVNVHVWHSSGC